MGWQCGICGTTDKRKKVVHYPPRCWDCLDVRAKLEPHPPVFQDMLDSVALEERSSLPCLFKKVAQFAK